MDFAGPIRLTPIQSKDGVHVYRVLAEKGRYVLKYFEAEPFRREIRAYQILAFAGIPTVEVFSYTDRSLLMEDISHSRFFRMGREEDLSDSGTARRIAGWYRQLHEKGADAADLPDLYRETDCLTAERIGTMERKGILPHSLAELLEKNLPKFHAIVNSLSETLTYNDFYWTNLIAAADGSEARMLDYNLLGRGYRYADLRNVCSALSGEAAKAFLEEYGGFDPWEKQVDSVAAPLTALAIACERETFPEWADSSLETAKNGEMFYNLGKILS